MSECLPTGANGVPTACQRGVPTPANGVPTGCQRVCVLPPYTPIALALAPWRRGACFSHVKCDLLNTLAAIGEAGAGFKSLHDAWVDTTTAHGRLMLTVLGGLAEFERELILARTGEGRTRAKARGVRFGRPPSLTAHQRQEAVDRLAAGEAQADVARSYNVSQATISRLAPGPFAEAASVGAAA